MLGALFFGSQQLSSRCQRKGQRVPIATWTPILSGVRGLGEGLEFRV